MTEYTSSPREDKAKLNERRIQAKISELLQENPPGLHFNEIFRQLKNHGLLNNNNILVSNLKQLMLRGLVKKIEAGGGGFGKRIYRWVGQDAHDLEEPKNLDFNLEISGPLPFVLSAKFDKRGDLERVHIERGRRDDFCNAVRTLNAVSEYCKPVNRRMAKMERRYLAELLGIMLKVLQIQSSILRDENPAEADANWPVYLSIVMNRLESYFESFALYASKHSRHKMMKNVSDMRRKFVEICSAMITNNFVDLDRVTIHEASPRSSLFR
jgi:hypothetical protein